MPKCITRKTGAVRIVDPEKRSRLNTADPTSDQPAAQNGSIIAYRLQLVQIWCEEGTEFGGEFSLAAKDAKEKHERETRTLRS